MMAHLDNFLLDSEIRDGPPSEEFMEALRSQWKAVFSVHGSVWKDTQRRQQQQHQQNPNHHTNNCTCCPAKTFLPQKLLVSEIPAVDDDDDDNGFDGDDECSDDDNADDDDDDDNSHSRSKSGTSTDDKMNHVSFHLPSPVEKKKKKSKEEEGSTSLSGSSTPTNFDHVSFLLSSPEEKSSEETTTSSPDNDDDNKHNTSATLLNISPGGAGDFSQRTYSDDDDDDNNKKCHLPERSLSDIKQSSNKTKRVTFGMDNNEDDDEEGGSGHSSPEQMNTSVAQLLPPPSTNGKKRGRRTQRMDILSRSSSEEELSSSSSSPLYQEGWNDKSQSLEFTTTRQPLPGSSSVKSSKGGKMMDRVVTLSDSSSDDEDFSSDGQDDEDSSKDAGLLSADKNNDSYQKDSFIASSEDEDAEASDESSVEQLVNRTKEIDLLSDDDESSFEQLVSRTNEIVLLSDDDDDDDDDHLRNEIPKKPVKRPAATSKSKVAFLRNREKLGAQLLQEYDRRVFGGKLLHGDTPPVTLTWNKALRTTAGYCKSINDKQRRTRSAVVELSTKVIDDENRLRSTLLHELCHAAAWLIDGSHTPPHGPVFQKWAKIAMRTIPGIQVTTCHSYEVSYKYAWACTRCPGLIKRHSRSVDPTRQVCGRCQGRLQEIEVPTRDTEKGNYVPRKKAPPSAYNIFVKKQSASVRQRLTAAQQRGPPVTQAQVLTECARLWKEEKENMAAET